MTDFEAVKTILIFFGFGLVMILAYITGYMDRQKEIDRENEERR